MEKSHLMCLLLLHLLRLSNCQSESPTSSNCSVPCSVAAVAAGAATGAFITGVIVGVLGVLAVLLIVKRPCSVDKNISSEKTRRFTRSEAMFHSTDDTDTVKSLPLYHTKPEKQTYEKDDVEFDDFDKISVNKGPLPPPPPDPAPQPPSARVPALTHKPRPPTEQYDIPYVKSASKPSETPLEDYDIPDISTPIGLTTKLSKSQTNITKEPSGKPKLTKKPLVPSKSMVNLGTADDLQDEFSGEHYYVMDLGSEQAIATRSAKFQTTQTLQHSASSKTPGSVQPKVPPPKIKRKPLASQLSADTVSYVKKESSNFHPPPPPGPPPAEDSTSPESNHPKITVNRPPLRPPILPSSTKPMPSQPGKARHVTKAYSSKAVAQKPYVNPSRSHSQSVTGSEPHHYKNIDSTGRVINTDLTVPRNAQAERSQRPTLPSPDPVQQPSSYSSHDTGVQYMNIGRAKTNKK